MGGSFDLLQAVSLGLFSNGVVTLDQVRNLARDNVVSDGAKGFADLGIQPAPMDLILPTYLWRFRPTGQFEAIKESSRNLTRT
jgi:NADH dehydrogenase